MDLTKIAGIARHIIGGLGAALIGFGIADQDTVGEAVKQFDVVAGGVIFLVGVVMSIVAKIRG